MFGFKSQSYLLYIDVIFMPSYKHLYFRKLVKRALYLFLALIILCSYIHILYSNFVCSYLPRLISRQYPRWIHCYTVYLLQFLKIQPYTYFFQTFLRINLLKCICTLNVYSQQFYILSLYIFSFRLHIPDCEDRIGQS